MSIWHDTRYILRYELKLLSRDWLFRVTAVLTLPAIGICHVVLQTDWGTLAWEMIGISSAMPVVNAWLFNIVQCTMLVLLIPDLYKQEQCRGELESIYTRPFYNSSYRWGKIGGVFVMLLLLQGAGIAIGVLLNVFCSPAPFCFSYYVFYLLTLTLPVAFFFTGVGLCLSGYLISRYIVQTVLFFIFILAVDWLPEHFYGIADLWGTSLPVLFSDFTGQADGVFFLRQRMTFVLIGLGGICLVISRMKRLPDRKEPVLLYTCIGIGLIGGGIINMAELGWSCRKDLECRETYRKSFLQHWEGRACHIADHQVLFRQKGKRIVAVSDLLLVNPHGKDFSQILLFLNPGLEITAIKEGGKALAFERDQQVVLIKRALAEKDSVFLSVSYKGKIDERFSDLHLSDREWRNTSRQSRFFHFGRRTAFLEEQYLLLTPVCAWYPSALPPVFPGGAFPEMSDYTRFRLSVVKPLQRQLLAQGERTQSGDTLIFTPACAQSGMTVAGGDYKKMEWQWAGLDVRLYYLGGHDFFMSYFNRMTKDDFQTMVERDYTWLNRYHGYSLDELFDHWQAPSETKDGKVLMFVETPLAFSGEFHRTRTCSDRVQPGLVLLPERGVGMEMKLDFRHRVRQVMMANGNSIGETEAWVFNQWVYNFHQKKDYYIYPMFHTYRVTVYSEEYPFTDLMFKSFLHRYETAISNEYEEESEARKYLEGKRISEVLTTDGGIKDNVWEKIVMLKSEELMNRLMMNRMSRKEWYEFLNEFYTQQTPFVELADMAKQIRERWDIDLIKVLREWSEDKNDACFQVLETECRQVGESGVVRAKLRNTGHSAGMVTFYTRLVGQEAECHSFFLQPGEAKEIEYSGYFQLGQLLLWSANVPVAVECRNIHAAGKRDIPEPGLKMCDLPVELFYSPPEETLIDDSDEGFSFTASRRTLLQRWLKEEKKGNRGWRGLNEQVHRWTFAVDAGAYGDKVKGFHYKMGGKGSSEAVWTAHIKEKGIYELMVLMHNQQREIYQVGAGGIAVRQEREPLVYHYKVCYDGKEEQVEIEPAGGCEWVSLGEFELSGGEVKVKLTDQGKPYHFIIADAIKWIVR